MIQSQSPNLCDGVRDTFVRPDSISGEYTARNGYQWCGADIEDALHCLRDSDKAHMVWLHLGLNHVANANHISARDWIIDGIQFAGSLFLAAIWTIWTSRNKFTFDSIPESRWEILPRIHSFAATISNAFSISNAPVSSRELRFVSWERPRLLRANALGIAYPRM
ncbi:LINE-1 reverse transcriptase isogeny [Sesbania bispinosa]|nr:LINE-1 reverse transcriptase isogeny [Sesbania bispinosa]